MNNYDPHGELSTKEVTLIGQALLSDLAKRCQSHRAFMVEVQAYCERSGHNYAEVRDREIAALRENYDLLTRFVFSPFDWEFFLEMAGEK